MSGNDFACFAHREPLPEGVGCDTLGTSVPRSFCEPVRSNMIRNPMLPGAPGGPTQESFEEADEVIPAAPRPMLSEPPTLVRRQGLAELEAVRPNGGLVARHAHALCALAASGGERSHRAHRGRDGHRKGNLGRSDPSREPPPRTVPSSWWTAEPFLRSSSRASSSDTSEGAFTGAVSARQGAFEAASGGTILLDEIGELSLDLQPKILRALERKQIKRIGSTAYVPADVRVLAATNRSLRAEVAAGRFRSDLYYRLAVLKVQLPPLRDRVGDIPTLVDNVLVRLGIRDSPEAIRLLSPEFVAKLSSYRWSGNVRQLRNYLERCVALGDTTLPLTDTMLPPPPATGSMPAGLGANMGPDALPFDIFTRPFKEARDEVVSGFERRYLETQLARHDNNVSAAARASRIDRIHFYRLLWKHGLRGHDPESPAEGLARRPNAVSLAARDFPARARGPGDVSNDAEEAFESNRLLDELQVQIAEPRFPGELRIRAHHHHRDLREGIVSLQALDQLPTAHERQHQIDEENRRSKAALKSVERIPSVVRRRSRVAGVLEKSLERSSDRRIVFDDKNRFGHHHQLTTPRASVADNDR